MNGTRSPNVRVALLWHQHQPCYTLPAGDPNGVAQLPWVRLHATRDYHGMAAIAAEHDVKVSINLVPALVQQLVAFADGHKDIFEADACSGASAGLPNAESLRVAFEAHEEHQIGVRPAYARLHARYKAGEQLDHQDLRDALVWQQLSWFPPEERWRVQAQLDGHGNFSVPDAEAVFHQAREIARRTLPLHQELEAAGRIEVTTTPYFHPILPLLIDSDRPGEERPLPNRYAYPEDAVAQVRMAVEAHTGWLGRKPRGMWPSEGAVSQDAAKIIAAEGLRWIATDQGILERAGITPDARALSKPWRVAGTELSIFFRDRELSDRIGFVYANWKDAEAAADDFVRRIADKYRDVGGVVPIVLDGENAWGWYKEDGRPFLHALYNRLAKDPEVGTCTFTEAVEMSGVLPELVLPTGSWIDDPGSAPGVDLGTWIGKPRKNALWDELGAVRKHGLPEDAAARMALYAAEGSDWFWWGHRDDSPGVENAFRDLFRRHLAYVSR